MRSTLPVLMFGLAILSGGILTVPGLNGASPLEYRPPVLDHIPLQIILIHKDNHEEVRDGHEMYADAHRQGWDECLQKIERERLGKSDPVTIFSDDLDIPFSQEWGFTTNARAAGYAECRRAIQSR